MEPYLESGTASSELIEQYKAYLEDLGNIGVRHENTRRFYLSVISALFVFLSLAGDKGLFRMVQGELLMLVAFFAITLCVVWVAHMQVFGALYSAKFSVLKAIENTPGFFPIFKEEYKHLRADRRYIFLTLIDTAPPILFVVLFLRVLYLK